MSWDRKGANGPYFYQSVREGDRVRKVYVGRGARAEELARAVAQRRLARQAAREARQRELARAALAERQLRDLRGLADLLTRATLLGAGYHQHKGQWRRRGHARDGHQGQGSSQP